MYWSFSIDYCYYDYFAPHRKLIANVCENVLSDVRAEDTSILLTQCQSNAAIEVQPRRRPTFSSVPLPFSRAGPPSLPVNDRVRIAMHGVYPAAATCTCATAASICTPAPPSSTHALETFYRVTLKWISSRRPQRVLGNVLRSDGYYTECAASRNKIALCSVRVLCT